MTKTRNRYWLFTWKTVTLWLVLVCGICLFSSWQLFKVLQSIDRKTQAIHPEQTSQEYHSVEVVDQSNIDCKNQVAPYGTDNVIYGPGGIIFETVPVGPSYARQFDGMPSEQSRPTPPAADDTTVTVPQYIDTGKAGFFCESSSLVFGTSYPEVVFSWEDGLFHVEIRGCEKDDGCMTEGALAFFRYLRDKGLIADADFEGLQGKLGANGFGTDVDVPDDPFVPLPNFVPGAAVPLELPPSAVFTPTGDGAQ